MYMCIYIYMYIHVYTCIYMYIHVYTCTYMHAYIHTYLNTYMHTCIHAYVHTCIHAYIHTCKHTYKHTYIHIYIHIYIYIFMDIYIYTYIYNIVPFNAVDVRSFWSSGALPGSINHRSLGLNYLENSAGSPRKWSMGTWGLQSSTGWCMFCAQKRSIWAKDVPMLPRVAFCRRLGFECEEGRFGNHFVEAQSWHAMATEYPSDCCFIPPIYIHISMERMIQS